MVTMDHTLNGSKIVRIDVLDDSIDALKDMDGWLSQVAAMDGT